MTKKISLTFDQLISILRFSSLRIEQRIKKMKELFYACNLTDNILQGTVTFYFY